MTKRTEPEPEGPDAARAAIVVAAVIGGVFSLGALFVFSARTAISVGIGAVIAVANLVALSAIIRAILRPPPDEIEGEEEQGAAPEPLDRGAAREAGKRGGAAWGGFAVLKMVLLFGGVWILLTRGLVDPIPLVVGYGVLPLGITIGGLLTSMMPARRRRAKRD